MGDVHHMEQRLDSTTRLVNKSELSERNKELIMQYKEQCFAEGLSVARVQFYLTRMYVTAKYLGKDFDKADISDIRKLMAHIERVDYTPKTKNDYRVSIKRFYKWLEGNSVDYPLKVRWIGTSLKNHQRKLPDSILTQEEVRKIINAAPTTYPYKSQSIVIL